MESSADNAAIPAADSPGINLMPPTVFYACLVGGALLEWAMPSQVSLLPPLVRIAAGLLLSAAGFAFMAHAHETFKRRGTNVPTNQPATAFVVHGAYRISRNPMYVGGSALFLGIGLAAGSLWMLAAYIPLGAYVAVYVIPREESYMRRTYGDDYTAYCRRVGRIL